MENLDNEIDTFIAQTKALDWEEIQGQLVQETKGASAASNLSLVGRIISLKPINNRQHAQLYTPLELCKQLGR
jgi:hypothetical protein